MFEQLYLICRHYHAGLPKEQLTDTIDINLSALTTQMTFHSLIFKY